jgi:hypothetical protein
MVLPSDDDWKRQVVERAKELDHEHRRKVRPTLESGVVRVLSLRLLRTLMRRLVTRPICSDAREVAHPAPGHIAVTFRRTRLGHADHLSR